MDNLWKFLLLLIFIGIPQKYKKKISEHGDRFDKRL